MQGFSLFVIKISFSFGAEIFLYKGFPRQRVFDWLQHFKDEFYNSDT